MASRMRLAQWAACWCIAALLYTGQPVQGAGRSLRQQDALSNSDGCLPTIPKCEPGACATRNVFGVARWVCLRCLSNYAPVVDASGQDNIVQCVCPKGYFENNTLTPATNCTRCAPNQYCPGGDMVENPGPNGRGAVFQCGNGLVTRTSGARSIVDCVAQAGYALSGANSALPCNPGEYAPQFNRLGKCLRCQSGLLENPNSNLQPSDRFSKANVCKVPPGRYMSQGLVRWCPQGFYRVGYLNFTDSLAQVCVPCNQGITTAGAGMTSPLNCSVVLPGYGVNNVNLFSNGTLQNNAAPALGANGLPNATVCNISFYSSPTGNCVACPLGTVTRTTGAKTVEECVVPPGYIVQAGTAVMSQCANSTFRAGWVMYSDPSALLCTSCGTNIWSEPRDMDENPLAPPSSLVRSTSFSCYILAGQGMIAQGNNLFVGQDCPINTYGAAGQVYGWAAAPCKPCPRNMITDNATRVNNSDVCVNDDGFGYASEGASRCAAGFYSAKGSRKPCQQCAFGRTTTAVATQQRLVTDCFVAPGFGVASSQGNGSDGSGFFFNITGLTDAQAAALPVLECPIGWYSAGGTLQLQCTRCPDGSSTLATGSTSALNCSICIPGYGRQTAGSTLCTPCAYGTYQPGFDVVCTQCPQTSFFPPVDNLGATWTSNGTTLFTGATGVEACVPIQSQLSPDAGQAYFPLAVQPDLVTVAAATTLGACIALCPGPANGCLVQWETGSGTGVCKYAALQQDLNGTTGTKLKVKLPPSTMGSASSIKGHGSHANQNQQQQGSSDAAVVRAKTIASGYYARLAIPAANVSAWARAGVPLDNNTAQGFKWGTTASPAWDLNKNETECQGKVDRSVVAWGFLYDADNRRCLYLGGEDALLARAFLVLPDMAAAAAAGSSSGSGTPTQNNSQAGDLPVTPPPTNACTSNPCTSVTNSTTVCTVSSSSPGYSCSCAAGFTWVPSTLKCSACANSPAPCASVANSTGVCTDAPFTSLGYSCSCSAGYAWDAATGRCLDVNECLTSNGGCAQTCTNTPGSFTCSCSAYYNLTSDGRSCTSCSTLYVRNAVTPSMMTQNAKPLGLAISPSGSNLLWVDNPNRCVQQMNLQTRAVSVYAGKCGANPGDANLTGPVDLAFHPTTGNLYIADTATAFSLSRIAVRLANSVMAPLTITSGPAPSGGNLGVAVHPTTGALLVADDSGGRLLSINLTTPTTGVSVMLATGLSNPQGVAVSPTGMIAVASNGGSRVFQVNPTTSPAMVTILAGGGNSTREGVLATSASLDNVRRVAYAADGALLVTVSNAVKRVDPVTRVITTLAGPVTPPNTSGFVSPPVPDGTPATQATLKAVWGIAVDPTGNVYFEEAEVAYIRRLSCNLTGA